MRLLLFGLLVVALPTHAQSLANVMELALAADPRVDIAAVELQVSENRERQALGNLLPQVSASANFSANEQRGFNQLGQFSLESFSGERYNLTVQQPLYNRSAFKALSRSGVEVDQREFERDSTVSQVLLEAARRYVNLLAARQDVRLVIAEEEALQEQMDQVTALYERQLVKVTDLFEVRSRLDLIQASRIEAANGLEVARQSLAEMIGQVPGELTPLRENVQFTAPSGTIDDWLDKAISANHLLRSLEQGIEASNVAVEEAKGSWYPTLDLVLNARQSNTGFENSPAPTTDSTYVALNLNLPIYAGGITTARVAEANNRRELARLDYERTRRGVVLEVQETWLGIQSTLKSIAANERSVESAAQSVQAMETTFQYSAVTAFDVVNAVQREFRARRELLQAKYDHLMFRLRLLAAAGELTPADVERFDRWFENSDQ